MAVIELVRRHRRLPGLAVRNDTPIRSIPDEILSGVDVVNLVAVRLGWGGSVSAEDTLPRIAELRRRIDATGGATAIEVDGGVDEGNAGALAAAGAEILVAGTAIYACSDPVAAIGRLRTAAEGVRASV